MEKTLNFHNITPEEFKGLQVGCFIERTPRKIIIALNNRDIDKEK